MKMIAIALVLSACAASQPRVEQVAGLAGRRAQMLAWLHDYEVAGVFPTDDAGMPISVFRDARGVRCPMAELIYRSGRGDLVDAVAARDNALRLADVHDGPLYDWMLGSGLTQEEIAMVQGALTPDEENRMITEARALVANAQVHGRLQMAQVALRDGTTHSLQVAATRGVVTKQHGPSDRAGLHAALDRSRPR